MICLWLTLLYIADRTLKSVLVFHFFRRKPLLVNNLPSVSLIQPITRGVAQLEHNLRSRLHQFYPAALEHCWVCDEKDETSLGICQLLKDKYPQQAIKIILATPGAGEEVASKIQKMNAALAVASNSVFTFIDDDIALLPDALRRAVSCLTTGTGAVFGVACGTSYRSFWSGMMSSFVNVNAMMTYLPATYILEPYTITGHFFAVKRSDFEQAGGFGQMQHRVDDDHELARRLIARQLKVVQTPVCYAVSNEFAGFRAFSRQMQRWFVIPRNTMLPYLSVRQQLVTGLLSIGMFLPALVLAIALFFQTTTHLNCLLYTWIAALAGYNTCFAHNPFRNWKSWLFLPFVVFLLPLQVLWFYFFSGNTITWRGQQLTFGADGRVSNSPDA